MTTRKHSAWLGGAFACWLAGCATPGPLHVYSVPAIRAETIRDDGHHQSADWPSFLAPGETITGFAYDPYTDHFFLRLAPGNRIRVVDRPARKIKRELELDPDATGGDLALRPLTGHLYLLRTGEASVLEITRLGKTVRTFALRGANGIPTALAFDAEQNHLLVLGADRRTVTRHDLQGEPGRAITLAHAAGGSLAFDSVGRCFYATSDRDDGGIEVFDESGKWLRREPARARFVDVGPRSLVRVF